MIDKLILDIKEKTKGLNELETIRYVYLYMGLMVNFDSNFIFRNKKIKQKIYYCHINKDTFNRILVDKKIICKSLAYLMEYIFRCLDIWCVTKFLDDQTDFNHVYNQIKLKDGRVLDLDLQLDLVNIKAHLQSKYFGNIDFKEIEKIDYKLGYISKENYYADEYVYLIKSIICYMDFSDKIEFLLNNLDVYNDTFNMEYVEFYDFYMKRLDLFLSDKEKRKIMPLNMYIENKDEREYTLCLVLLIKDKIIYVYDKNLKKFKKVKPQELKDYQSVSKIPKFMRVKKE